MQLSAKKFARQWYDALVDAELEKRPTISRAYLEYVYQNGGVQKLPSIMHWIEQYQLVFSKIIPVVVTSAFELSKEKVDELVKEVLGEQQYTVTYNTNPELVGGVVIETPNERWNLSIDSQLKSLALSMNR